MSVPSDPDARLAHGVRAALIALLGALELWMESRGWHVVSYDRMRAAYRRASRPGRGDG